MDFWLKKRRPEADFSGDGVFVIPKEVHQIQKHGETMDPDPDADLALDARRLARPKSSISVHHDDPNKYNVTFSSNTIETTVTCSGSTASEWVRQMTRQYASRPTIVGLASEWLPTYQSYSYEGLATLQLCIHNSCLILQMHRMDYLTETIKEFLDNTDFIFVGVNLDVHMHMLSMSYGLDCSRGEELGFEANFYYPKIFGNKKPGLRELAGKLFWWWLEVPEQSVLRSDWGALRLSEAQVEHACIQAFVNFMIGDRLQSFAFPRFEL